MKTCRASGAVRLMATCLARIRANRRCHEMRTISWAAAAGLALVVVFGGCTKKSDTQGVEEKMAVQGSAVELSVARKTTVDNHSDVQQSSPSLASRRA